MEVRQNLRGGISPGRSEMYILREKLAPFCGAGMEVRQIIPGGISPGRPEMNIFS